MGLLVTLVQEVLARNLGNEISCFVSSCQQGFARRSKPRSSRLAAPGATLPPADVRRWPAAALRVPPHSGAADMNKLVVSFLRALVDDAVGDVSEHGVAFIEELGREDLDTSHQ
jgi:hypothetical protein